MIFFPELYLAGAARAYLSIIFGGMIMATGKTGKKMNLEKRPLGNSGMQITTVGVGTWAIGGGGWSFGWGPQDDNDSIAAIRRGVALGINWVDTAAVYGFGHSEEVVGRAINEIPASERPYVFTKCGMVFDPAKRFDPPRRDLRPQSIRNECTASLR